MLGTALPGGVSPHLTPFPQPQQTRGAQQLPPCQHICPHSWCPQPDPAGKAAQPFIPLLVEGEDKGAEAEVLPQPPQLRVTHFVAHWGEHNGRGNDKAHSAVLPKDC